MREEKKDTRKKHIEWKLGESTYILMEVEKQCKPMKNNRAWEIFP